MTELIRNITKNKANNQRSITLPSKLFKGNILGLKDPKKIRIKVEEIW